MTLEELETQEKDRKAHLAREAQRILGEPIIDSFLRNQEAECFEAFKRLPLGAKLEEYQTVHHDLLSIIRFKVALETYITEFEHMELRERKGTAEEI